MSKLESQNRANNALNHCGFSAVVFLFGLVHSPIWPLLQKMSNYDNLRVFLAEAHDDDIEEFIPEYLAGFEAEINNADAMEAEREV